MDKAAILEKITGLTQDSRAVRSGYLFAALPGSKFDGRAYIGDALRNGAVAVLVPKGTEKPADLKDNIYWIESDHPRRDIARLAAAHYKLQPERIVAVTGTNGKTSVVNFVMQLWEALAIKGISIGTLGVRGPGMIRSGSLTTPDPVSLHAELADIAAAGFTHLAIEASSHGLDQYRLDGLKISAAGFTSFSRDHLDYHADMESYFGAKGRLFSELLVESGSAVLNADIPEFAALSEIATGRERKIMSYGYKGSDYKILKVEPSTHGQNLSLEIDGVPYAITLPLVGQFQVMNALCALGLVLAESTIEPEQAVPLLQHLKPVPGRLQLVSGHPKNAAIYVDYAHTPDALEIVLKALRSHVQGRLVCLFGCGGDRDSGKRPIMGKVAAELADHVIVTDDNPRSENPAQIRAQILKAAPNAQEIGGRRKAIHAAIADLEQGDILVIAGKGHEQGQIFADHTEPFDDSEEAKKAIEELGQS